MPQACDMAMTKACLNDEKASMNEWITNKKNHFTITVPRLCHVEAVQLDSPDVKRRELQAKSTPEWFPLSGKIPTILAYSNQNFWPTWRSENKVLRKMLSNKVVPEVYIRKSVQDYTSAAYVSATHSHSQWKKNNKINLT